MRVRSVAALVVGLLYASPVAWMVAAAFKRREDALVPLRLWFRPTLDHVRTLLAGVDADGHVVSATGFGRNIANSVGIGAASVTLAMLLGTLAAYGLSRMRVRGSERLLFWMLALRMMPPLASIVPLYVVYSRIGLGGSYAGIVAAYVAFDLPFVVWMLVGFLRELPRDAEAAAWLDGSGRLRILWRVCLPQLGPGIAATATLAAVFVWNDFLMAQMLTGQDTRTIPIAMLRVMGADVGVDWGVFAAAGTIYLAPIFVVSVVMQRHLLRAVTFGTFRSP